MESSRTTYRVTFGVNGNNLTRTITVDDSETDDVVMTVQQMPEYRVGIRLISIEAIWE